MFAGADSRPRATSTAIYEVRADGKGVVHRVLFAPLGKLSPITDQETHSNFRHTLVGRKLEWILFAKTSPA